MAARTKSKLMPRYETWYWVKSWPAYEGAPGKRRDITVWFDEAAIEAWSAPPSRRPGGQRRYPDLAIATAPTLLPSFTSCFDGPKASLPL